MSAVWLHVGQCGNQIGEEWWQILTSEKVPHAEADRYPFCSPDGKLSAICVDSEPKVVRKLQKRVRRGSFRETNLIVGKRGRGNNWAYGYHGLHSASEKNLLERTMESLRKEVERRDCYCGTVLFHSLGGGTGAGVQTKPRLCPLVFSETDMLVFAVAPGEFGLFLISQGDSILGQPGIVRCAFVAACVSRRTARILSPQALPDSNPSLGNSRVGNVQAGKGEFFPTGWGKALKVIPGFALPFVLSLPCLQHYSTSVLAVAHSYQEDTFLLSRDSVLRKLKQAYRCVSWNPFPLSCWTASLNIVEPGCQSHSLTVCANHSSSAELLQQVVARAEAMYKTNACLHWYWRYGCEEEDFQQAFETLCSVADDYSRLGE
ncbi:unnamed protein product [Lepidochelys kempii]